MLNQDTLTYTLTSEKFQTWSHKIYFNQRVMLLFTLLYHINFTLVDMACLSWQFSDFFFFQVTVWHGLVGLTRHTMWNGFCKGVWRVTLLLINPLCQSKFSCTDMWTKPKSYFLKQKLKISDAKFHYLQYQQIYNNGLLCLKYNHIHPHMCVCEYMPCFSDFI